jgi:hypothetical protein
MNLFGRARIAGRLWYNFSMDKIAVDGPKAPLGFLSALWKGIEFVNAHPDVLVLPVVVDAFLWFGPHLSVYGLVRPVLEEWASAAGADPASMAFFEMLRQLAVKYNLFSNLAFIPLFPPSLMASMAPDRTPLGNPIVLPISNWPESLGAGLGMILVSLMIGAAYWIWAGRTTQTGPWTARDAFSRWARTVLVMALIGIAFLTLILMVYFPAVLLISAIGYFSNAVGSFLADLLVVLGGSFLFWLILFVMFSLHGTVLYRDNVFSAVWNSVNTSRWMYPVSIWIPILLIGLNMLTFWIWTHAPDDNWAGVVGIVGNAYTSSVVVVASMAYYIDKRRWISEVRTYLQTRLADKNPPRIA